MKYAFIVLSIIALAVGVTSAQAPATSKAADASGALALGSVQIPKSVKADGKPLAAGTYQVRLTADSASPNAAGETQGVERWVEFMQGGQVKGREVATIVAQADAKEVLHDAAPAANASKFEMLKGGDYYRLWINKGGNHYLVHFPGA